MKYFGTSLTEHGHYLWDLNGEYLKNKSLDIEKLPFNPESYPKRKDKYEEFSLGTAQFHNDFGYSILAIEGSCIDKRSQSKSVFFVKEELTKDEMIERIKSIPIAMKIIKAMPFEVHFW